MSPSTIERQPVMVLEFELTHEDLVEASVAMARSSRSVRLVSGGVLAATSAVLLGAALLLSGPESGVMTALLGVAGLAMFQQLIVPRIQREQMSATLREGRNLFLTGRQRLVLDDDGISVSNWVMQTRVRWAGVERIVPTETHIIIYYGAARGIVVPRTAFGSNAAVHDFIEVASLLRRTALTEAPAPPALPGT